MPILTRKSLLTYRAEQSYSTVPTGEYTAVLVRREPDVAPLVADRLARETVRPFFGADRKKLINKRVTINFDVELAGSGTPGVPPAFGGLLLPCAFSETIVPSTSVMYTLVSDEITSATLRWYQDGIVHQTAGAQGTVSIMANAGEYPMLRFEFTGLYSQPTDEQIPVATYANQAVPVEVSASNTPQVDINAEASCMSEFELSINNDIAYEDYAGCGAKVRITGRNPEGRIQVEDMLTAANNFYNLAEAAALVPIAWVHDGGGDGNTVALTASSCDIYEPSFADRNGVRFINLPFSPISESGSSELLLTFT